MCLVTVSVATIHVGEGLSEAVQSAVPRAVEAVLGSIVAVETRRRGPVLELGGCQCMSCPS